MGEAEQTSKRLRTCISCGLQKPKENLHRIVRTPEGAELDESGRKPGRGAYVCSADCLAKAQKKNGLGRALKTNIKQETYECLVSQLQTSEDMATTCTTR